MSCNKIETILNVIVVERCFLDNLSVIQRPSGAKHYNHAPLVNPFFSFCHFVTSFSIGHFVTSFSIGHFVTSFSIGHFVTSLHCNLFFNWFTRQQLEFNHKLSQF